MIKTQAQDNIDFYAPESLLHKWMKQLLAPSMSLYCILVLSVRRHGSKDPNCRQLNYALKKNSGK